MAKINRYNGNLEAFASNNTGQSRKVFGQNITESDALDDNINADFLSGWEIIAADSAPPKEWFNAVGYTSTLLSAYLHQSGMAEWNASQEYYAGNLCQVDGVIYKCMVAGPLTGVNPTTDQGGSWIGNSTAVVSLIDDLRGMASSSIVYISGHSSIGDGGEGHFRYVSGASPGTYTDDNGTTIVPTGGDGSAAWLRQYKGRVNVRWFGATGDGSTNDKVAIQTAITNYESIFIPKGSYILQGELSIPSNRFIELDGRAELKGGDGFMTSSTGYSLIILQSDASNITIKGGTINGNSTNAGDLAIWPNAYDNATSPFSRAVNLIVMQSNDYVTFDGVRFINNIYTAIKEYGTFSGVNEGTFAKIINCYFDNILGNCIDGEFAQLDVSNNTVNLIGDIRGTEAAGTKGGLIVCKTKHGVISDNNVNQTTDSTIYITGSGYGNISVTGNSIKYSGKDAIKVLNSSCDCTMTGNVVTASGKSCIGIYDDGSTDKGNTVISGNVIGYEDTPTDILDPLNSYAAKTITGCTNQSALWIASGYISAAIGASASGLSIIGNTIKNVLGIAINPTEDNIVITGNVIENCTGTGVKLQGSECVFSNNIIKNVGTDGNYAPTIDDIYGVRLGQIIQVTVSNNNINGTGSTAIYGEVNVNRVEIIGNNIYDWNGSGAIYINSAATPDSSKKINMSNNTLVGTDSAIRCIYLRGVDDSKICNNIIDTAADGIRVNDCGSLTITGNRITNITSDAFYCDGSTESVVLGNNTADTVNRGFITHTSTLAVRSSNNFVDNFTTTSEFYGGTDVRKGGENIDTLTTLRSTTGFSGEAVYVKAFATAGDGGEGFYRYTSGAAPGTYVDNSYTIIVPTGGDGSAAWLRSRNSNISGSGSPEGVVSAAIGFLYLRSDGGAGTTLYIKESGTGNTGWVAK